MSRPRILDHARRGAACAMVAAGMTLTEVASRLGCSRRTLARERARNEDFRLRLAEAELLSGREPLESRHRHARTNWRAAAWLLERTDPHQYGPRRPTRCDAADFERTCTRMIEAALEETPSANRDRMFQRLAAAAAAASRDLSDAADATLPGSSLLPFDGPVFADAAWPRHDEHAPAAALGANGAAGDAKRTKSSANWDAMETLGDEMGQNRASLRRQLFGELAARLRKSRNKTTEQRAARDADLSTASKRADNLRESDITSATP